MPRRSSVGTCPRTEIVDNFDDAHAAVTLGGHATLPGGTLAGAALDYQLQACLGDDLEIRLWAIDDHQWGGEARRTGSGTEAAVCRARLLWSGSRSTHDWSQESVE